VLLRLTGIGSLAGRVEALRVVFAGAFAALNAIGTAIDVRVTPCRRGQTSEIIFAGIAVMA